MSDRDGDRRAKTSPADAQMIAAARVPGGIETADSSTVLFAGFAPSGGLDGPIRVESFADFAAIFGSGTDGPFMPAAALAHAVRGFFGNGGEYCLVQRIPGAPGGGHFSEAGLDALLGAMSPIVAVPDAFGLQGGETAALELHRRLLDAADRTQNRFVVIDPPPGLAPEDVILWRRRTGFDSPSGVMYYPWINAPALLNGSPAVIPPSGHVLGSWARTDGAHGIHHAPTGQSLLGVDAFAPSLTAGEQRSLNREGINCLRSFPGPEPRVWGARTLSGDADWRYLHRRRTYANLITSIGVGTAWVQDAPIDEEMIERLQAAVATFLQAAWRRGALQGAAAGQAFSIQCEPSQSHPGYIALEVGLALRHPADHRVARITLRTASAS